MAIARNRGLLYENYYIGRRFGSQIMAIEQIEISQTVPKIEGHG